MAKPARGIAALLSALLTVTLLPAPALAAEEPTTPEGDSQVPVEQPETPEVSVKPQVTCKTALAESSAWQTVQGAKKAGRTSGSKAVTALRLTLKDANGGALEGGISYRAYVSGKGWTAFAKNGERCGTKKKSQPVQALRIKLTGAVAKTHTVYYRVNLVGYGWTGWGKNGESVGARKLANVRGYQVKVVEKGAAAPGSRKNRYFAAGQSSAEYFYAQGGKTRPQLIKAIGKAKGSGLKAFGAKYSLNTKAAKKLKAAIKQLGRYKLSFVMMDLTTGAGISYNPGKVQYSASAIKGPYVAAVNKYRAGSAAAPSRCPATRATPVCAAASAIAPC